MPEENHFDLIATGHAGRFRIEVDEPAGGPEVLFMTIIASGWDFRFSIPDPGVLPKALSFLSETSGTCIFSEIVLGSFRAAPVRLIKDDEFEDRFWIRAYEGGEMVEFTIVAPDIHDLIGAIGNALDDLSE
ncbi:MAG TPA: hypothetical protein VG796_05315 [Verrucomicrobiales bacterium]|nr:hypothetical protein [Verrucomicrobiales bacterium]